MSEDTDHGSLTASHDTYATASNDGPLDLGSPGAHETRLVVFDDEPPVRPDFAETSALHDRRQAFYDEVFAYRVDDGAGACGHGSPDLVADDRRPALVDLKTIDVGDHARWCREYERLQGELERVGASPALRMRDLDSACEAIRLLGLPREAVEHRWPDLAETIASLHPAPVGSVEVADPAFDRLRRALAHELAPEPRRGPAGWRATFAIAALVVLVGFVLFVLALRAVGA